MTTDQPLDSLRNRPVSIIVNRSVSKRKTEVAIRSNRVSAQDRRESAIRTAVADFASPAAEAKGDAAK
ncbi:hypothetical protein AB0I98_18755 [Streptomyces sp. NPDC050211]|uniref:hypothetical protein n=1 Tax=Streptomyces sp. NPDC050211 TaxID=3154932 RepID=UPI0034464CC5